MSPRRERGVQRRVCVAMKHRPQSYMQMALLSAYFLLPMVIYCLPSELIFSGNTICLSQLLFGCECPGCGMTRALYLTLHGDLYSAVEYNCRVVFVAPLLLLLYVEQCVRLLRQIRFGF